MPDELTIFIIKYGYLAIFLLVFSQEIGIPNLVPNELVLIFAAYLTTKGILYLPFVILTAIIADFIGTNILYTVFYFFGHYIIRHKPPWIPISVQTIEKYTKKISDSKKLYIYIGRLTPFIRGYTSVACGLLNIKPKIFLSIALISATIWSSFFVITGRFFCIYLNFSKEHIEKFKPLFLTVVIIILISIIVINFNKTYLFSKRKKIN